MNVLSLFDGMSCGRLALGKAGIQVGNYYSSEIDKYAIKVADNNYPQDIQNRLGDITKITKEQLLNLPKIDLLIGGSPCQGLSSSNVYLKEGGYGINGTGASRLFWEYIRIYKELKIINPNIKFLLENVGSSKIEDREIINKELETIGVKFNSNLLSAQKRNRIYWSNISFKVPKERIDIYMQDILENNVNDKYYLTEKMYNYVMKPASKGWQSGKMEINLKIARPLTATMHKMHRADTDNYISTKYKPLNKTNVRRLTPLECERLQTVPDNYTNGISDTQKYRMLGNGWTVDVIAHIFKGLK